MTSIGKLAAVAGSLIIAVVGAYAAPAAAQATRTWVSGVGDDANPCSRTAPCKTFAGAISKTAAGGEINCIDPGGFGGVTITKSISIICDNTEAGVLVSASSGIIVNAGVSDIVYLSGLDIHGVSSASFGISFLNGATLHVNNSVIRQFALSNGFGIRFVPASAAQLFVTNTIITTNGNGPTGGGILAQPTGSGNAKVSLSNVQLQNNAGIGVRLDSTGSSGAGIVASIEDSSISGSPEGIRVVATGPLATLMLNDSVVTNNTTGITTDGASAVGRVGNTTIAGNGLGVSVVNSSTLNTYGDNRLANTTNGSFNLPIISKN